MNPTLEGSESVSSIEALFPKDSWVRQYDGISNRPLLLEQPWSVLLPCVSVPLYLLMVFFLPKFIKKEYNLKWPLAFWNLFLSIASLLLLIPWVASVLHEFIKSDYSAHHIICMPNGELSRGLSMFAATVYALLKFAEFGDTLFLILRKRPVNFLHWYHHATVLLYSWFCLLVLLPIANIFGIINAFVHTIMYGYYFLSSVGSRPWWGKYITKIQLAQMVLGLIVTVVWGYWYLSGNDCNTFVKDSELSSGKLVIIASTILYGTYFALFLKFYLDRFGSETAGKGKKPVGNGKKGKRETKKNK
eukprot:TRINITY_DN18608_c0_g1_i1.p1 TRINITY_DN18608_c0_g1~~TRINITY_DN18608_c0_g1_i1.p1  ORF type:complete len:303 (+),score=29.90 TRINITY_DN18608_c0_g1_i1:40-948(+)